ncbi:PAS domain S-box-containing protein [Sphingomonas sp. BE138]|uniref:PAS domain S-box protein n=1 Tax=Sphingomonas sp. BE138 TaxID=2817845 RepID=UPI0028677529|nr:PAS domain S-box protein [Sphingomonas sp. BE138]MDR6786763.1 PAS domain S-box-containing protein [Sphingomonas sp. BE138]
MSCLTDEQLRILDADDDYAAMLGYSRDALIGRSVLSLTHPDDRDIARQQAEALVSGGTPFSITKRYVAGDGHAFWATSHVSLFHAGANRRIMATVELLDSVPADDERRVLRLAAERILAKRRLRHQFFDEDLFGEPAFDLLLDLYAQALAGRATYTTSAAVASGAPLTTALRQIATLVDRGLVAREADPVDRRRVLLCLTDEGSHRMRDYLLAAEQM